MEVVKKAYHALISRGLLTASQKELKHRLRSMEDPLCELYDWVYLHELYEDEICAEFCEITRNLITMQIAAQNYYLTGLSVFPGALHCWDQARQRLAWLLYGLLNNEEQKEVKG